MSCFIKLLQGAFLTLLVVTSGFSQPPSFTDTLDNLLNKNFPREEPGGAIVILKNGKTIFANGYGVADINTKKPITPQTIFNLGSISKTFVANGILILQEEGKLSISDPITKYFPDFEYPETVESITIEHLLSHTSGLPDLRKVQSNQEYFLTAKDQENWQPIKQVEKLRFTPGARFEYSNPSFNGLALIIEKVSGQKWQAFIKENILVPSGMKNSTITEGPHPESGVAHAYRMVNGNYVEYDYGEFPTFAAAGNGGIWSSVSELVLYEKALQNEVFINAETLTKSRTAYTSSDWEPSTTPFVGHSWFLDKDQLFPTIDIPFDIVYHTGSQGGFRAYYIYIPEKEILFLSTFNRPVNQSILNAVCELLSAYDWLD